MAVFALTDASVVINSVDLSDHISQVSIDVSVDELDTTAFGTNGWASKIGGQKDWSVSIDFHQDFAASEVDATLWPLLGTTTTIVIKPTSSAVSATNPSYSGSVLINDVKPVAGSVGQLATMSVTWPGAGALARATS